MPFPQNQKVLTLIHMNPTQTVLVSNLPENTPEFAIQMYFDKFGPIDHIRCVPPTQALLTFKSHEGEILCLGLLILPGSLRVQTKNQKERGSGVVSYSDPTHEERVWWHSADFLGFIKIS